MLGINISISSSRAQLSGYFNLGNCRGKLKKFWNLYQLILKEFVFFDDFCPIFPSWVGPNPSAAYLKESWDKTSSLHAIHFRYVILYKCWIANISVWIWITKIFSQFGFQSQNADYNTGGATIYYHCFLKVCSSSNAATCSLTTVSTFRILILKKSQGHGIFRFL